MLYHNPSLRSQENGQKKERNEDSWCSKKGDLAEAVLVGMEWSLDLRAMGETYDHKVW